MPPGTGVMLARRASTTMTGQLPSAILGPDVAEAGAGHLFEWTVRLVA